MEIDDQIEAALRVVRNEMVLDGGSVRLVRLDGQIAFLELSGSRSLSWTFRVTTAVEGPLPQLTVLTSLCPAAPGTSAGT